MKRSLLFITGTRADFGKLKPLIRAVHDSDDFEYQIFGTGMHLLSRYGNTIREITKSGFHAPFTFINQVEGEGMEMILANTVKGLSRYLYENKVDMIIVHGDRVEALASAIVGAMRNVLVAHVEGGEISGTIDELLRHSTSKLSHIHFVASEVARKRLIQLGELENSIFNIGSADVDVMLSDDLPSLEEARARYDIIYENYSIAILHPVTTENKDQLRYANLFVDALIESKQNYVVVYPNNDLGAEDIFESYERIKGLNNFKVFPSIRFEYFLTLLKHSNFIIGNSSVGIHEAPVYGVPSINVGSRQKNRLIYESIINVDFDKEQIAAYTNKFSKRTRFNPCKHYGDGRSAEKFIRCLRSAEIWNVSTQKQFNDLEGVVNNSVLQRTT